MRGEILAAGERPAWLGYVVAVTAAGEVLGAAGGGMRDGRSGQVYVLYLRLAMRGAGIGTALLDFVTDQQRRRAAVEQWVSVTEGNELGLPFYRGRARGVDVRERMPFVVGEDGAVEAYSVHLARPI